MLGRTVLGEARTAVAARPAMAVTVASDGASRALGELECRQQGVVPCKPGARERFGAGAQRVARTGGRTGVRRRRWTRCRETEVEETVSGNLVNKLKFQNQF